jgi:hypothetical protein
MQNSILHPIQTYPYPIDLTNSKQQQRSLGPIPVLDDIHLARHLRHRYRNHHIHHPMSDHTRSTRLGHNDRTNRHDGVQRMPARVHDLLQRLHHAYHHDLHLRHHCAASAVHDRHIRHRRVRHHVEHGGGSRAGDDERRRAARLRRRQGGRQSDESRAGDRGGAAGTGGAIA